MGKNGYDPAAEESAARVHELNRQPIATPAECAEEAEVVDQGLLGRALTLRFRLRGLSEAQAAECVADVFAVIKFLDRAVCEGAAESAVRIPATVEGERRHWLEAMLQVEAWSDARCSVRAILFAHGEPAEGCDSIRKIAAAAVPAQSPENVNNRVDRFQEIFELPRTHLQKSEAARRSYKNENGAKR